MYWRLKVEGMIKVSYTVMCKNDAGIEIALSELIANEKVAKAIKSEFAKGLRNLSLGATNDATVSIKTDKQVYKLLVNKNDFADLLELAEEDARKHKRLKKECDGVELVDIQTID